MSYFERAEQTSAGRKEEIYQMQPNAFTARYAEDFTIRFGRTPDFLNSNTYWIVDTNTQMNPLRKSNGSLRTFNNFDDALKALEEYREKLAATPTTRLQPSLKTQAKRIREEIRLAAFGRRSYVYANHEYAKQIRIIDARVKAGKLEVKGLGMGLWFTPTSVDSRDLGVQL